MVPGYTVYYREREREREGRERREREREREAFLLRTHIAAPAGPQARPPSSKAYTRYMDHIERREGRVASATTTDIL